MADESQISLDPKLRVKYLKIWAGYSDFHRITTCLHFLDCHFPPAKLELALDWLLRNNLIGSRFVEWYHSDCDSSPLEMQRQLLSKVEKAAPRRLHALKDLK